MAFFWSSARLGPACRRVPCSHAGVTETGDTASGNRGSCLEWSGVALALVPRGCDVAFNSQLLVLHDQRPELVPKLVPFWCPTAYGCLRSVKALEEHLQFSAYVAAPSKRPRWPCVRICRESTPQARAAFRRIVREIASQLVIKGDDWAGAVTRDAGWATIRRSKPSPESATAHSVDPEAQPPQKTRRPVFMRAARFLSAACLDARCQRRRPHGCGFLIRE